MRSVLQAFPRLHAGLIDLGRATARKYGGAGFTISGPIVEVAASPSREFNITGLDRLDARGQSDVLAALERLQFEDERARRVTIAVRSIPPQHVGLGSKTALILGVLKAVDLTLGLELPKTKLQLLSGRGGTSGIGVNAFFSGGFLVDGGHAHELSRGFSPSSIRRGFGIPPVVCRVPIPPSWHFHLVLPRGRRLAGELEVKFFKRNTPVPRREVFETIALTYHGLVPAVVTRSLPLLRSILARFHETGFKRLELEGQSEETRKVFAAVFQETDCAVGLSSMGPLVYAIEGAPQASTSAIKSICARFDANYLGQYHGRNRRFQIV